VPTRAAGSKEGRLYSDKQLVVMRTDEPVGLSFSGEMDATNSRAVADSLSSEFAGDEDIHLDLSQLSFCDISGIRCLVEAAQSRKRGRLMLHGLPPLLQTVMTVTGWSDQEHMVVCAAGAD
jgi:anti-anti-sigma factor